MKATLKTNILYSLILILASASCSPGSEMSPNATATQSQLPFNDTNFEDEFCQSPKIVLSLADANGLDENEIAGKLMEKWLAYFHAPQAPDYCRIDDYRIDKIFYDEQTADLPLEPKGDFMRIAQFSILLVQMPNFWMSWSGQLDQQNWFHTGGHVAVFRNEDGYTFEFAHP